MSVVLIAVMATAIGLTAAIWDSASGGSSEYGPVVDAVDWNSWAKYFTYENILDSYDNIIGRAIVRYEGTNLKDVIIPVASSGAAITTIRNTVFDSYTLKQVPETLYISRTIATIDAATFSNMPNLTKVVFADGVEINVGAYCFAGCTNLKEIIIEGDGEVNRTVNFDATAFKGCYNLETITGKTAAEVAEFKS